MIRNACAVLMCSRGTPMFLAGDEFGNTQYGNNNGYCQDNEISWLNWNDLEKNRGLFEFFKYMIAFRQEHRVIREKLPDAVCGMDPIHTHDTDAERTDIARDSLTFCVSFAGYDLDKGKDDLVYIAVQYLLGGCTDYFTEGIWKSCLAYECEYLGKWRRKIYLVR